jgi:murein DD-endopeptidase MepM/ murein hydrolase activator NlpD
MRVDRNRSRPDRRHAAGVLALLLAGAMALVLSAGAPAQDLQAELDTKELELQEKQEQKGVLTTTISKYTEQIDQLAGEVAVLRNREAVVQEDLDRVEAQLTVEVENLRILRARLERSLDALADRLVAMYKADEPDTLTVILEADGFDDLLDRYEYLSSVERQDSAIANRVHDLRNETKNTVVRIRAARDELAAKKAELERTRSQLEAREADLDAVRGRKQTALGEVRSNIERLEGNIGDLEGEIQAQLQAAQSTGAVPAGPVQGESSSGLIWPVNGPVVSPFGMRWGRMHEGIDIAVPSGTPIRAAASGRVALAAYTGGYGNYTCVDHGGGLATCYAHQSSYAVGSGQSVRQGQVIGSVGCTGSCFGDHLHFEVRVNGAATDPMGYL